MYHRDDTMCSKPSLSVKLILKKCIHNVNIWVSLNHNKKATKKQCMQISLSLTLINFIERENNHYTLTTKAL